MRSKRELVVLRTLAVEEARESFWAFRQYMDPALIIGWWQRDAAQHLQRFYEDLIAGRRPKLLILAPPQHGKSEMVRDFIAWLSGKLPDNRTIFASFSDPLGTKTNRRLQHILDSDRYRLAFPEVRLADPSLPGANLWQRNQTMLEFVDRRGFFRNTTVRGAITGEGLDLGVVDDPIKSREEANSAAVRDSAWGWFNDDFRTRFAERAGLLFIMTRWHIDDPAGRLIRADPSVKVLRYPAIAEQDEEHRRAGEPLFPELKSLAFLLDKKQTDDPSSWESLYQQNPVVPGGNLFKIDQFRRHKAGAVPPLKRRAIYADTAQKTGERNDYSVFQVWGLGKDGVAYLLHQVRGKMEAPELEATARALWRQQKQLTDPDLGNLVAMKVEDKTSGTGLIQQLCRARSGAHRVPVLPIKRGSADKVTRAMDVLPSIAAGLVSVPEDTPWIGEFFREVEAFPSGAHDDQVDPLVDAVADLLLKPDGGWGDIFRGDPGFEPYDNAGETIAARMMERFGYAPIY